MRTAAEIAAQCWCTPQTSDIEMDDRLVHAFADALRPYMTACNEMKAALESISSKTMDMPRSWNDYTSWYEVQLSACIRKATLTLKSAEALGT